MAGTDWNPDTGGRPLAEILREAGIDPSRAAKRRRWDEPDEPIRQRRPDAEPPPGGRAPFGRRRSDLERTDGSALRSGSARSAGAPAPASGAPASAGASAASTGTRAPRERQVPADPSTAAIPGLRPDRAPAVPHPSAPLPDVTPGALRPGRRDRLDRPEPRERETGRTGVRAERPSRRPAPRDEHTSTGPIPVVRAGEGDELDAEASPRESALAWLRFAGELVIALAVGVGVFFAATVLWEMAPYVALLLVPLAVTGLVAGVGAWRHRQGSGPVGGRLLTLLVLAGTLLTIAPAAQLLATR